LRRTECAQGERAGSDEKFFDHSPSIRQSSNSRIVGRREVIQKRLSTVLLATEYLFLENIALKLVLEHREVANWQKLLDHLLSDKEMLAGVRLKFSDLYRKIDGSADPSSALEAFLGGLPAPKKTH
jgi:hypothetical protein